MKKRGPVGIFFGLQGSLVHQAANGEMGHQQAVELLPHQFRSLGAEHDLGAAQAGLQFVEGGFDLPTLVVEGGQFFGLGRGRVQDRGGQPVKPLAALDAFQPVIDDLSPIIKIGGVLQAAGKRYTRRGENATTLMDLRNGSSVIIGAFDDAWTLRMLRPLRFHFANNADMTMFSVADSLRPGQTPWVLDRRQQIATNNYWGYAIVARFTDETTGRPTLVAAGIGRGGTIAAGEFFDQPGVADDGAQPASIGEGEECRGGAEHTDY